MNNPFIPGPDGGIHVLEALANVRSQISPFIEKNAENKHHKYTYTDELALIASTRAAMVEHNLMLVPTETSNHNYENNGKMYVDTFTMHGVWISLVDGSTVNIALRVSGADSLDKGAYKADTGFIKYAIWKTFNIATGDDAERDEYSSLSSTPPSTPKAKEEKPSRRRRTKDAEVADEPDVDNESEDEEPEEKPARSRRAKKEVEDKPTRRKSRKMSREVEEDDDEEEEEKPKRRAKKEDEEEPKPRRRRAKAEPEEEEDDEPPFDADEEEEEEKPKPKAKAKAKSGDDDPYGIGLTVDDIEAEMDAMEEEGAEKAEYVQFINTHVKSIVNPALRSKFRKDTAPLIKRFIS